MTHFHFSSSAICLYLRLNLHSTACVRQKQNRTLLKTRHVGGNSMILSHMKTMFLRSCVSDFVFVI